MNELGFNFAINIDKTKSRNNVTTFLEGLNKDFKIKLDIQIEQKDILASVEQVDKSLKKIAPDMKINAEIDTKQLEEGTKTIVREVEKQEEAYKRLQKVSVVTVGGVEKEMTATYDNGGGKSTTEKYRKENGQWQLTMINEQTNQLKKQKEMYDELGKQYQKIFDIEREMLTTKKRSNADQEKFLKSKKDELKTQQAIADEMEKNIGDNGLASEKAREGVTKAIANNEKVIAKIKSDSNKTQDKLYQKVISASNKEYELRKKMVNATNDESKSLEKQIAKQQKIAISAHNTIRSRGLSHEIWEQEVRYAKEVNKLDLQAVENKKAQNIQMKATNDYYAQIFALEKEVASLNTKASNSGEQESQEAIAQAKEKQLALDKMIEDLEENGLKNAEKEMQLAKLREDLRSKAILNEAKLADSEEKKVKKLKEYVELEQIKLRDALNKTTGNSKLNFDEEDIQNIARIEKALDDLNNTPLERVENEVKTIRAQIEALSTDVKNKNIGKVKDDIDVLGAGLGKLATYVSGAMIIQQLWSHMGRGVETVKQLDSAITTLNMTMGSFSNKQVLGLIDNAKEMSKELSATMDSVLLSIKTVANESETLETIINKSKPAVILSNLSGLSTDTTIDAIQGATRAFDDLANATEEDAMRVADSMVSISKSLGMDFSTGIQGMTSSLATIGSFSNQVGLTLEETLATVSGVAEATRLTFDEVATGMRNIMARTMRISDADMGIGETEMLKAEKALASIGVTVRSTGGDMRSFNDIIEETANKWQFMSQQEQMVIADALGGAQRISQVTAIMENYGRVQELTAIAMNGTGAAMEAQGRWAESLEAKLQRLDTSVALFWQTLVSSDSFATFIDMLTVMMDNVTEFVDSFGGMETIFTTVTTLLVGFTSGGKALTQMIIESSGALTKFVGETVATSGAVGGLGVVTAGTTLKVLALKTLLTGGIALAVGVAVKGVLHLASQFETFEDKVEKSEEAVKNFLNETKNIENTKVSFGEYQSLTKELEELQELNLGKERQIELEAQIEQLRSRSMMIGDEDYASLLYNENIPLEERVGIFERLIEQQEKSLALSLKEDLAEGAMLEGKLNAISNKYMNFQEALANSENGRVSTMLGEFSTEEAQKQLDSFEAEYIELVGTILKHNGDVELIADKLGEDMTDSVVKFGGASEELYDIFFKVKDSLDDMGDGADDANEKIIGLSESMYNMNENIDSNESVSQNFVRLGKEAENVQDIINGINENGLTLENMDEVIAQFSDFTGNITDTEQVLGFLSDKYSEVADAQKLAYTNMIRDDEEFWAQKTSNAQSWQEYINNTNVAIREFGQMMLGEESQDFVNHINEKLANRQIDMQNATTFAESERILVSTVIAEMGGYFAQHVNKKGEYRGVDMSNIIEFLNTQGAKEAQTVDQLAKLWADFYNAKQLAIQQEINDLNSQINNSIDTIEGMDEVLGSGHLKKQMLNIKKMSGDLSKADDYFKKLTTSFGGLAGGLSQNMVSAPKPTGGSVGGSSTGGTSAGSGSSGGSGGSSSSGSGSSGSGSSSSGSGSSASTEKEVEDMEKLNVLYRDQEDALNDINNALNKNRTLQKHASAQEKVKLMKEELSLLEKQAKAQKDLLDAQRKQADQVKNQLKTRGFTFDASGDISNYEKNLNKLIDNANSLSGEAKQQAIDEVNELIKVVDEYVDLINKELPKTEEAWLDNLNTIKDVQQEQLEFITDVQSKISDAISKNLEEQTKKIKSELQKQKDLYNETWDEEDYQDKLQDEQNVLDDIQLQINNLSRDTSVAGQLKLKQLMEEYEEQQKKIHEMIIEKSRDDVNNAFDEAMDREDEKLEEALKPENLAGLVNQALTEGFVELDGKLYETEDLLVDVLSSTEEAFFAIGDVLRTELIENLEIAKSLMDNMNLKMGVSTAQLYGSEAPQTRSSSPTIMFNEPLVTVQGNITQDVMPAVERMIQNAQENVVELISKAMR